MIDFSRDDSGLYLAEARTNARVAFLFQDAARTDPSFDLTSASWIDPTQLGFVALFPPSATRDWTSFARSLQTPFTASLVSARERAGQNASAIRRVKVGDSFQFALAAVSGGEEPGVPPGSSPRDRHGTQQRLHSLLDRRTADPRARPLPFGPALPLAQGQSRFGPASGGKMAMTLATTSSALALFAIVGGPCDGSGSNATVVAITFSHDMAPAGYTAVTIGPSYSFDLDWLTNICVAFFGPGRLASPSTVTASGASVRLVEL